MMKFAQYVDVATLTTQSYRDIKNEILLLRTVSSSLSHELSSIENKKKMWCTKGQETKRSERENS